MNIRYVIKEFAHKCELLFLSIFILTENVIFDIFCSDEGQTHPRWLVARQNSFCVSILAVNSGCKINLQEGVCLLFFAFLLHICLQTNK